MRASHLKAATVVFAAVGFLGCGGKSNNPAGPSTNPPVTITILGDRGNLSFSPNPAVAGGQMVVFRNNDTVAHRVRLNDLSLDWGVLAPGATSQPLQMPAPGSNYHCQIHPTMIGAVTANANEPPPRCTGDYC